MSKVCMHLLCLVCDCILNLALSNQLTPMRDSYTPSNGGEKKTVEYPGITIETLNYTNISVSWVAI